MAERSTLSPLIHPLPPTRAQRWREGIVPYAMVVGLLALVGVAIALRLGAESIRWARPSAWLLLLITPLLGLLYFYLGRRRSPSMVYTRTEDLRAVGNTALQRLMRLPEVLRIVAVFLLVAALAQPQRESPDLYQVEGIDIVVALDVSNSMSEQDLRPNRLEGAKEVLRRFIERRRSDRLGLVIFGKDAFTQCPLTLDYRALEQLLADVRLDLIDGRGTAIGNALGTALNRLRRSDAKSKVIILLTDGDNNSGNLAPIEAARIAQSLGVKIFTVLMGRDADPSAAAPGPLGDLLRSPPRYPVNPKLLETIAGMTGGMPYLATDTGSLERRLQQILDELERSRIRDRKGRAQELFAVFLVPALGLLVVEGVARLTRFRRFP